MEARLSGRKLGPAVALVLLMAFGALALLGLYSRPSHYAEFLAPARSFLSAAVAGDSIRLVELNASPTAINSALALKRNHSESLARLAVGLYIGHGMRRDTNAVLMFGAKGVRGCPSGSWPLVIFFEGPSTHPTIRDIELECDTQ